MNLLDETSDYTILIALMSWIEAETGLCFPEVHHDTIRKTAHERCKVLEINLSDYLNILQTNKDERCLFFNEIMIGETYFFRDERHFSLLLSSVLPKLFLEERELHIWSATCASGEEVISLIAVLKEVHNNLQTNSSYKILASDINKASLLRLENGSFPLSSFRNDGKKLHELLDDCGTKTQQDWQASSETLSYIQIKHLNILSDTMPPPSSQDIVFFRNTLVYMKNEQKEKAISRIIKTLKPGGFLFLASPEVPTIRHEELEVLEREGTFFFRKRTQEDLETLKTTIQRDTRSNSLNTMNIQDKATHSIQKPTAHEIQRREMRKAAPKNISALEIQKGLETASLWTLNASLKDSVDISLSEIQCAFMIEEIVGAIQANRFTHADELIKKFEAIAKENYVSLYLRALSKKHQGDNTTALELWEHARLFNPKFWPALFQAGLSYEKTNQERSRTLLTECVKAIQNEGECNIYLILLEGFDTSYFERMAEKLIMRMKTK